MTAHPVHQVTTPAAGVAGWQWLHRAAEMAAVTASPASASASSGNGQLASDRSASSAAVAANGSDPLASGWTCVPRVAMRAPGVEPSSVSAARRFTTLTLRRWGIADREADITVVVSELLSNALRHGLRPLTACPSVSRPIRLGLMHVGPNLLCAVADPSERMPVPREPCWLDETGRGLHVIASLSDKWGSCTAPNRPGKVVWATFSTVV
jgi:hypothetical protein